MQLPPKTTEEQLRERLQQQSFLISEQHKNNQELSRRLLAYEKVGGTGFVTKPIVDKIFLPADFKNFVNSPDYERLIADNIDKTWKIRLEIVEK